MLRVTVEALSGKNGEMRRTIGIMHITTVNEDDDTGDYGVSASETKNQLAGTPLRIYQTTITGYHRKQSVWRLIAVASTALRNADYAEW